MRFGSPGCLLSMAGEAIGNLRSRPGGAERGPGAGGRTGPTTTVPGSLNQCGYCADEPESTRVGNGKGDGVRLY